jgi:hypothetical protein
MGRVQTVLRNQQAIKPGIAGLFPDKNIYLKKLFPLFMTVLS